MLIGPMCRMQEGIASDNRFVSELLLDLQMGLSTRFNKYGTPRTFVLCLNLDRPASSTLVQFDTNCVLQSPTSLLTPISFSLFSLRFIQEQDNYITHLSAESKRAGVLAPFAKFPSFVDRLQQVRPNM